MKNKQRDNSNIQKIYQDIYHKEKSNFFSRFVDGIDTSETNQIVLDSIDWNDKTVLDLGCGTGDVSAMIAEQGGAKLVTGIDYVDSAIRKAKEGHTLHNLDFSVSSIEDWSKKSEVVVSLGVLEHMDDPERTLKHMINLVESKGIIVITCPYFLNIRGYVWMTLVNLLDVPMSLTDLHYISPFDIEKWLIDTPMKLEKGQLFDHDRSNGFGMIVDMKKRLFNALSDANLPNHKVETMISWLENVIEYQNRNTKIESNGANALYIIKPKK